MDPLTKIAIGVVVLVLFTLASAFGGYEYAQREFQKDRATAMSQATEHTQQLTTDNAVAAAPIVHEVERIKVVTQTLIQKVPEVQIVHVPVATQDCPALLTHADGVLIDAAARGDDPPTGPIPDGPPVSAQAATASVVDNYGTCRADQTKLRGLQDYVQRTLIESKLLCPGK